MEFRLKRQNLLLSELIKYNFSDHKLFVKIWLTFSQFPAPPEKKLLQCLSTNLKTVSRKTEILHN